MNEISLSDAQNKWSRHSKLKYAKQCKTCKHYAATVCQKKKEFLETLTVEYRHLVQFIWGVDKDQVCRFYK